MADGWCKLASGRCQPPSLNDCDVSKRYNLGPLTAPLARSRVPKYTDSRSTPCPGFLKLLNIATRSEHAQLVTHAIGERGRNSARMNILVVASEVVPLAKTGGLADVAGALPRAVESLGHSVSVVMPCYRQVRGGRTIMPTDWKVEIPIGKKLVQADISRTTLPDSDVPVYLIDQPAYFDRESLYGEKGKDYVDNCERFVFFSRAALELARQFPFEIDVIHVHDWQTGLVPVYLQEMYRGHRSLRSAGSLCTVHNLAFQGNFWHWDMLLTGLDWRLFNWRQLEFYGKLNLLKAGIVFSDLVNTVSRRYATEIQTPEFGCGLEGVLQSRKSDLSGIVNGIDYSIWNPESDTTLDATYNEDTFVHGKPKCKAAQIGRASCR